MADDPNEKLKDHWIKKAKEEIHNYFNGEEVDHIVERTIDAIFADMNAQGLHVIKASATAT